MKFLFALTLLLVNSTISAQIVPMQRLTHVRLPTAAHDRCAFGQAIATSDRYIAVAAKSEEIGSGASKEDEAGAVYVFSTSSGALVRRIQSPTPSFFAWFGSAVAVDNSRVYVCESSRVYAFDIATGRQLWTYAEPTGTYGRAMAITGTALIVGFPEADFPGAQEAGKVVRLDALKGTLVQTYEPTTRRAKAAFGHAVLVSGQVIVASAPEYDRVLGSNKEEGLIQIRDLSTGTIITEIQEATSEDYQHMGEVLSLQGKTLATTVHGGAEVWLYSLADTSTHTVVTTGVTNIAKLGMTLHGDNVVVAPATASDPVKFISTINNIITGYIMAPADVVVSGHNCIAIGNPDWRDATTPHTAGAAWIARPVHRSYPSLTKLAETSDLAPGATPGKFATITQQTYNSAGKANWTATLSGVPTATAKGTWNNISGSIDLAMRKGDNLGALGTLTDIGSLPSNYIQVRSGSTGRQSLWRDNGMALSTYFLEGHILDASGIVGQKLLSAAGATDPIVLVQGRLGSAGVTLSNDLILAQYDTNTSKYIHLAREGTTSPAAGRIFSQPALRYSAAFTRTLIAATLTGDTGSNQLLYYSQPSGMRTKIAQRGDAAPGTNGGLYSQFLGEVNAIGLDNTLALRATLSASPLTQNEAIFSTHKTGTLALVARKGATVDTLPTPAVYSRFLRTFSPTITTRDLLLHASFTGTGITPSNNEGIFHFQGTGSARELLLRKGDPAPGCGQARVGSILRMEADPYTSRYFILATLVGAPAGSELALFQGNLSNSTKIGRSPYLVLRKGTPVFRNGRYTVIKNLTFSTRATTPAGFPALEHCRQISSAGLLITITYSDNRQELVTGWPQGS